MNMHRASRLGWIRSSKDASPHAPEEVTDPAGSAASGRAPADAGVPGSRSATSGGTTPSKQPADRARRAPAPRTGNNPRTLSRSLGPKRRSLLLLSAALLLIPAVAYADVPMASIAGPETVAEDSDAVYTVTLTAGTGSKPVIVEFTVSGTATEGADADYQVADLPADDDPVDFTAPSGKLTIAMGEPTGRFTISTYEDNVREVHETLVVTLTGVSTTAGTVTLGSPIKATTIIRPAGTETVSFTATTLTVNEGDNVSGAEFTVQLSGTENAFEPVTVRYETVAGTATAADYTAASASGTVTISETPRTMTFTVDPVDDALAEDDETFTVKLTLVNPPADVGLGIASAKATITDDDDLIASVESQQDTVLEGSAGTYIVELTRKADASQSGSGSEDVVIGYSTTMDSTAIAVEDYELPSGTLTIPAGESIGSITIRTLPDNVLERNESLKVTLTEVDTLAGMVELAPARGVDNDNPAKDATIMIGDSGHTVTVSVEDETVTEGETAMFEVKLSGKVSENVTVSFMIEPVTATGTGNEADYTPPSPMQVTIDEGETTSRTLTVATVADKVAEDSETFTVTLDQVTSPNSLTLPGVALGRTTATGTILDDNALTVSVEVPEMVPEGSPVIFTVKLEGGTGSAPVIVDYEVGGTARPDVDYEVQSGTLAIEAGQPMDTIEIPTTADMEVGETLTVTLMDVSTKYGSVDKGTPSTATATITGQDTVTVSITANDATTDDETTVEEGGTQTFKVTLSEDISEAVVVQYQTAHGTATGDDYTATSGTLTIDPDDSDMDPDSKEFDVDIAEDNLAEENETFTVTLSLPGDANLVLGTASATATIKDDDVLMVSVKAEADNVEEGFEAKFAVTVSKATSTSDVVVKYGVTGTAEKSEDYTTPSGALTIPSGTDKALIAIPTRADDILELPETLIVTLTPMQVTTAAGEVSIGTPANDMINIVSSFDTVKVSVEDTAATEGEDALFTVRMSGKVSEDVVVPYRTAEENPQSATSVTDYTAAAANASLTIKAGEVTGTIRVATGDDSDAPRAEKSERFTLTLADPVALEDRTLPAGVSLGDVTATATIRDDDPLTVSVEGPAKAVKSTDSTETYTFRLTGGTGSAAVTVNYTENGTSKEATIAVGDEIEDLTTVSTDITASTLELRLTGASTDGAVTVASGSAGYVRTQIMPADTVLLSVANSVAVNENQTTRLLRVATFDVSPEATWTVPPDQTVTVRYRTDPVSGTGATTSDYEAPSGVLELNTSGVGTITVFVVDDDLAEADETFTVTLTSLDPSEGTNKVYFGTKKATAKITRNDQMTVSVVKAENTVREGDTAMFPVTLSGTSDKSIVVKYTLIGTADKDDYTEASDRLTIRAGSSTGTIAIRIVDDEVLEPSETLIVTLMDPTPAALFTRTPVTGDSATTTIGPSGSTVKVSVEDTAATEGEDALFTVTLSGEVSETVVVPYSTAENPPSATSGTDYTAAPDDASLTIKAGEVTGTIRVATGDDSDAPRAEKSERFTLTLDDLNPLLGRALPSGVSLGDATATATIIDDDRLTVSVEGPARAVKSTGSTETYTFRLTGGTGSAAVTVNYTENGTSKEATIAVGEEIEDLTTVSTNITASTLELRLTGASTDGAVTVASGSAGYVRTQIMPADTVLLSVANSVAVNENQTTRLLRVATFDVSPEATWTVPPDQTVTVRYRTDPVSGTGATTSDYEAPSGVLELNTSGVGTITVFVVDDDLAEADETFTVTLTSLDPSEGTNKVYFGTKKATAKITRNDQMTVSVVKAENTVREGDTAMFPVTLSGTSDKSIVVKYTLIGTADKDDYTEASDRLTIRAGSSTGTIAIRIVDDEVLEPSETLIVTLMDPTPAALFTRTPVTGDSAMTTIGPSDGPVTVSVGDTTVDEGEEAVFAVTLSGAVSETVVVPYSTAEETPPSATSGTDYTAAPDDASLTIKAGEVAGTIRVQTTDDIQAEATETFTLTLEMPEALLDRTLPAGISLGEATATAMITDDALTATVEGPASVNEGDFAVYTVSVTGGAGDDEVTVTYSTDDSTATAGEDYTPADGPVTFTGDEMSGTFTIQIRDDEVVDLREKLVVALTAVTANGTVRTGSPVTTTIMDDGTVEVSMMAVADPPVLAEGERADFLVELTGTVADEAVTLRYVTADGTAVAGEDYTAPDAGATVVIPAGEMSGTISVHTLSDGQDELTNETFSVSLVPNQDLPEGVAIDTDANSATIRITDHALTASVKADEQTVNEGSEATFTITLAGGDNQPEDNRAGVVVNYSYNTGTANPADYIAPSGTLTIPEGALTGSITIATRTDNVLDHGETLVVRLTSATTDLDHALARPALPPDNEAETRINDSGTVTVSVADTTIEEGEPATFRVTLTGTVSVPLTVAYVAYTTADDTATAPDDYEPVAGTVTIPAEQTEATITIRTEEDNDGEASETFTLTITLPSPPTGVGLGDDVATATITDDDIALLPVNDVTVTEGDVARITLTLERALPDAVMLGYSRIAGNATAPADYLISVPLPDGSSLPLPEGQPFRVPPNTQGAVVLVEAQPDTLAEGDEWFTVDVWTQTASGRTSLLDMPVRVTIEDANELVASVTAPEAVAEGETARFTVTLGGGTSTASVVVSYSVGGTAKAPGDYTAPSGSLTIAAGQPSGTIPIQTNTDNEIEPDETLVVTLDEVETANNGKARVGSPSSATTAIQDAVYQSINRVNEALLPSVARASAASALETVSWRMAEAAQGDPPAASADLAGLTRLYRALQANEQALQDGSYDLAKVLGGSSFLVPLSSHDQDSGSGVGVAVWGGGDFRSIGGGEEGAVDWDGSVWSARLGADLRFVDSLLTGLAVSWTSGALDYVDGTPREDREGTYASWLISAHPYVGWTTPDFGLWATGGVGWGGVTIDDSEADAQEADATQWSVGAGGSVTLLSTDWFIAGGTTALKLKAEGFLAGATVAENEAKTIAELTVGVNQARAAIEASHAQHFAGGGSLRPSLEIGGRFDGGDGETGVGLEVGGGLTYADPGSGLTVAGTGRALVIRDGNYGEWGLSGLIQLDPNAAGHGLMMSVRPTFGVTASGVSGLWEHGTLDLLSGGEAAGGRVEAEIGYGLAAFGTAGVLTPYAGASLTDAGTHSLSLGGRLELGPAFDLTLELERSDSADPDTAAEHDITLEGSFNW